MVLAVGIGVAANVGARLSLPASRVDSVSTTISASSVADESRQALANLLSALSVVDASTLDGVAI